MNLGGRIMLKGIGGLSPKWGGGWEVLISVSGKTSTPPLAKPRIE